MHFDLNNSNFYWKTKFEQNTINQTSKLYCIEIKNTSTIFSKSKDIIIIIKEWTYLWNCIFVVIQLIPI